MIELLFETGATKMCRTDALSDNDTIFKIHSRNISHGALWDESPAFDSRKKTGVI